LLYFQYQHPFHVQHVTMEGRAYLMEWDFIDVFAHVDLLEALVKVSESLAHVLVL